jgi:hypothetical protein
MSLTYVRRSLSTTAREALYERCRGDNAVPTCNICQLPVLLNEPWDESHDPEGLPHALGGDETGVAHRDCNRRHGAEVVIPLVAKVKRIRQKFIGAFRTKQPMPCGRNSARSAQIGGGTKPRQSLADFHRNSPKIYRREQKPVIETEFDRWRVIVEILTGAEVDVDRALVAFEEGVTASDYALQLKVAS